MLGQLIKAFDRDKVAGIRSIWDGVGKIERRASLWSNGSSKKVFSVTQGLRKGWVRRVVRVKNNDAQAQGLKSSQGHEQAGRDSTIHASSGKWRNARRQARRFKWKRVTYESP